VTEHALAQLMAADLAGLDLVALMLDGVGFAEHLCVVAWVSVSTAPSIPSPWSKAHRECHCGRDLLVGYASATWTSPGPSSWCWTAPRRCRGGTRCVRQAIDPEMARNTRSETLGPATEKLRTLVQRRVRKADPSASSQAPHPTVTSDARQERGQAMSTHPELHHRHRSASNQRVHSQGLTCVATAEADAAPGLLVRVVRQRPAVSSVRLRTAHRNPGFRPSPAACRGSWPAVPSGG